MIYFDLLTERMDCPILLQQLNLHCPLRILRAKEFLRPVRHATNYTKYNPINSMQINFNLVSDFFNYDVSRFQFKKATLEYFKQEL